MRVMLFAGCEVLSLSVVWVKATADDHGCVKSIRWLCLFIVLLFVDVVLFCCSLKHQKVSESRSSFLLYLAWICAFVLPEYAFLCSFLFFIELFATSAELRYLLVLYESDAVCWLRGVEFVCSLVKATADDHGSVKSIRWLCL